MVDEQTKRAIETMALCGCELDALIRLFPKIDPENVKMIWQFIYDSTHDMRKAAEERRAKVSINCS